MSVITLVGLLVLAALHLDLLAARFRKYRTPLLILGGLSVFFDVDFSVGPLTGVNFTTTAGGATAYRNMTPGTILRFRTVE